MNLRACIVALIGLAFAMPVVAQQNGGEILARSSACVFTARDFQDILTMDGAVLVTPLSAAEQEDARQRVLAQFRKRPDLFCKSLPPTRQKAEIVRHGSASERDQLGVELWSGWLLAASYDPTVAQWVAVAKRHNPPLVDVGGLTVTKRQVDALFASNDWVARTANLATSTAESRTAFQKDISTRFASLTPEQKQQLAQADLRWAAVQDTILADNNSRAKVVEVIHQRVHSLGDVTTNARGLEDVGVKYEAQNQAVQAMMQRNAQRTTAIIGGLGQAAQAQNLGQFNAHAPH